LPEYSLLRGNGIRRPVNDATRGVARQWMDDKRTESHLCLFLGAKVGDLGNGNSLPSNLLPN